MGTEIEKKYLIRENGIPYILPAFFQLYPSVRALTIDVLANGEYIEQGYLPIKKGEELADLLKADVDFNPTEARLRKKGDKLVFNMKGEGGLQRDELPDYEVPANVFSQYWEYTSENRIYKKRLKVKHRGEFMEIDVYLDRDLIVAEIEVPTLAHAEKLTPVGRDVTEDPTYKNRNLSKKPDLSVHFYLSLSRFPRLFSLFQDLKRRPLYFI